MERNNGEARRLRECMQHSFGEWGIKRSNKAEHEGFRKKCMAEVMQQSTAESRKFPRIFQSLQVNDLPRDQLEAIEHVLRKDLKDAVDSPSVEDVVDAIDIAWPPFFKWVSNGEISYRKSHGYEKVSATFLDPLKRFRLVEISSRRYLYANWSDQDCLGGTILEALVAHHVVHSASCYHCKYSGGLRWNGGRDTDSSWTDLVCLNCKSTYEIKSKKDAAVLEKVFQYSKLHGGSFRLFHANRLPNHGKRFVVLVARQPNDRHEFPVSIRGIDSVEPSLKGASFATHLQGYTMNIGTNIIIKKEPTALWCDVPCPPNWNPSFGQTWAKTVYEEHFGDGSWGAEASPVVAKKMTPASTKGSNPEQVEKEKEDRVEALREELDHLCDNWDDSEDEDETA